jgi:hypothetical protein
VPKQTGLKPRPAGAIVALFGLLSLVAAACGGGGAATPDLDAPPCKTAQARVNAAIAGATVAPEDRQQRKAQLQDELRTRIPAEYQDVPLEQVPVQYREILVAVILESNSLGAPHTPRPEVVEQLTKELQSACK